VNGRTIREELSGDRDAIQELHRLAFGGSVEADLVDALREGGYSRISLVAEVDGAVAGARPRARPSLRIRVSPIRSDGILSAVGRVPDAAFLGFEERPPGERAYRRRELRVLQAARPCDRAAPAVYSVRSRHGDPEPPMSQEAQAPAEPAAAEPEPAPEEKPRRPLVLKRGTRIQSGWRKGKVDTVRGGWKKPYDVRVVWDGEKYPQWLIFRTLELDHERGDLKVLEKGD
jgi:hypothetical protein